MKQKNGYKYYMPNWSFADIISSNRLLNYGLSSKVLKERYEEFGGIFDIYFLTRKGRMELEVKEEVILKI
jgi:hypothetical protein